jgi:hypothetical protein
MAIATSLSNATIYQPFSQTVTVGTGRTFTDEITSITVSKTPISTGSSATAAAYQSLTINTQDFLSVDSRTFNYGAGITSVTFTLAGTYTDYMFTDQNIKYYNNPTTISAGNTFTKEFPQLNVNVNSSNSNAYSFVNYQTSTRTETQDNTVNQFYYETQSWASVPNPVDAIYSFQPSAQGSVSYFTYNFRVVGTGLSGAFDETVSVTHTVNYDLEYERQQFLNVLNNQRF